MDQCSRIRLILEENRLRQRQLAAELGVTEGYISKLLREPGIRLSQSLAALIEEKLGYNARWVLTGEGPKLRQVSKNRELSELHQRALHQLEQLSDQEVKAVLAFMDSLDRVEEIFSGEE